MTTQPAARPSAREHWFGPINPDNAEAIIADLAKGWYFLGALALVLQSFLAWMAWVYPANLLDGLFCLVGGYFLVRRKSRALAAALLGYALFVGAVTFLGKFGVIAPQGGTNIILAIIAIAIGWRGCRATFVYQRKVRHRIAWKHVIWIWLSFILTGALLFIITVNLLEVIFRQLSHNMVGNLAVLMLVVFSLLYFVILTHVYPFYLRPQEIR